MNDFETKEAMKKLSQLTLSDSSRARMEKNLLEYARFHGVREGEDSRLIEQVPQRTSLLTIFKRPKSMTAAIIAIALIAGGGTSYAAQGAVPGDLLYPVKVEVNENIKSALAIGSGSEAQLQARLAQERLEEAQTLAARGELTAEASATLGAQVKTHYDNAMAQSVAAERDGNYEASGAARASLEGSFRTYAAVLSDLNVQVSGNDSTNFINEIRAYADSAAATQVQASSSIDASVNMEATARATVDKAGQLVAKLQSALNRAETSVSAAAHARAEARLEQAVSVHAEAKTSLEADAYTAAYNSAQTALSIANEVEAMINSMLRLDLDLNVDAGGIINIGSESEDATTEGDDTTPEEESDVEVDVEADVEADATIDTGVIDAVKDIDVSGDTSIKSSLGL